MCAPLLARYPAVIESPTQATRVWLSSVAGRCAHVSVRPSTPIVQSGKPLVEVWTRCGEAVAVASVLVGAMASAAQQSHARSVRRVCISSSLYCPLFVSMFAQRV